VFWLAIAMSLVGAAASLATPKNAGRSPRTGGDAATATDRDLAALEEELEDEFYRAIPLAPVSGAAQALCTDDDGRTAD
jgi:hypothetical protein